VKNFADWKKYLAADRSMADTAFVRFLEDD